LDRLIRLAAVWTAGTCDIRIIRVHEPALFAAEHAVAAAHGAELPPLVLVPEPGHAQPTQGQQDVEKDDRVQSHANVRGNDRARCAECSRTDSCPGESNSRCRAPSGADRAWRFNSFFARQVGAAVVFSRARMKVYVDGKFYEEHEAKISVFDHGLLYGDGVFEGIRAYNGRVFKLREHIDRLFYSAKAILLPIPLNHELIVQAVLESCPRHRHAGAQSQPLQKPHGHRHRRQDPALPEGNV
jgi:hypothetical protein